MFNFAIAGIFANTPIISSVLQYGNGTQVDFSFRGKAKTTYTVQLERESAAGSGTYSTVTTIPVTTDASGNGGGTGVLFPGMTFPAGTGYGHRISIISPVVTASSNSVTNAAGYITQPLSSTLSCTLNGSRDQVTIDYSGPGSIASSGGSINGSAYTSGGSFLFGFSGLGPEPAVVSMGNTLPVGGRVDLIVQLDQYAGFWIVANSFTFP